MGEEGQGEKGEGEKGEGEKGEGDNGGRLFPRKVLLFFPVIGEGERGRGVSMVYPLAILHQPVHSTNRPLAGTQYQSAISWYTVPMGH